MIKSVSSTGSVITSTSGYGSYIQESGVVRYNAKSQQLEVLQPDGNWAALNQELVSIGLSAAAESALMWAMRKQAEEANLAELCAQHPGLKDAKEKFEIMRALVSQP